MKKICAAFLAVLLVVSFSISAYAVDDAPITYEYGNTTFIFEADTVFDEAERDIIMQALTDREAVAEPCGLACLFGHDYESEAIIAVTHCASDTAPRCLEEAFEIQMCTRCDKTITELLGSTYIFCCD